MLGDLRRLILRSCFYSRLDVRIGIERGGGTVSCEVGDTSDCITLNFDIRTRH